MNSLKLLSAASLAFALVAAPITAMADTPSPADSADNLAAAVAAAADGVGGPQQDVSKEGGTYVASTDAGKVEVGDTSGSQVSLARDSASALVVGIPEVSGGATAQTTDGGTLVYDNDDSSVAVTVQTLQQGVRLSTVLKDASAPTEYVYPVAVPPGGRIETDPVTGAVLVTNASNALVGGFAPAWAKDANGDAVPTHYEVRADAVVQVVDLSAGGYAFPVIADPFLGADLIDHATWVPYSDGWTLQVYPTGWARFNAGSHLVGSYAWDELYTKYQNHGLTKNLNGMRDQLICHEEFVAVYKPGKESWNLDEWRPDVGYPETVNTGCNPGGDRWFD